MSQSEANRILQDAMATLHVDAFTLYVTNPLWPEHLVLVATPGVHFPEAIYGLSIAEKFQLLASSSDNVELYYPDAETDQLRRGISQPVERLIQSDPVRNAVFGDFIARERIASRAWFINKRAGVVRSALSANFRRTVHWGEDETSALHNLFFNTIQMHVSQIENGIRSDLLKSVPDLIRFLHHPWASQFINSTQESNHSPFDKILEAAVSAFNLSPDEVLGTIHLFENDSNVLVLKGKFSKIDQSRTQMHSLRHGEGVVSWVALRKHPVLINDLSKSEFVKRGIYVECMAGCQSELAVPICNGDELIGVLNLESTKKNAFSWTGVELLSHVAAQAALLYRLQNDVAESRRNEHVANEMLRICSDAPLLATLGSDTRQLNSLTAIARDSLGIDMCDIWEWSAHHKSFVCRGATYTTDSDNNPRYNGWSGYVLQHQCPIWISIDQDSKLSTVLVYSHNTWQPPTSDEVLPSTLNRQLHELDVAAELGMPLTLGQRRLGVAWFKWKACSIDKTQLPPLGEASAIAGQATLVLHSLKSQEESQFDAADMLDQIIRICIDIAQETDTEQLMSHLTEWVKEGMRSEICSLFLRDELKPDEWLVLRAAHGYPKELIGNRTHHIGQGITGTIVKDARCVRLNSSLEVRGFPNWGGKLDEQRKGVCDNLLGCPLISEDGRVLGTLKVENKRGGFSVYDEEILKAVCGVLAFRLRKDEIERDNWQAAKIGEFLHTFSTPLSTARWYSEGVLKIVNREGPSSPLISDITTILQQTKRFQRIVDNAGFFTKREHIPNWETVDIVGLLEKVVGEYKYYASKNDIALDLIVNLDSNNGVRTDPDLIRYIFENLLQNAIAYGGGPIDVSLSVDDFRFLITVEDNGQGVSDDELVNLTQPYYRGAQSKTKRVDGLGLGLSVCDKAASCLGGNIQFRHKKPSGLVADVTFPLKTVAENIH